jgi:hypothetical protein
MQPRSSALLKVQGPATSVDYIASVFGRREVYLILGNTSISRFRVSSRVVKETMRHEWTVCVCDREREREGERKETETLCWVLVSKTMSISVPRCVKILLIATSSAATPANLVIREVLSDIRHKSARLAVEPLEELPSDLY